MSTKLKRTAITDVPRGPLIVVKKEPTEEDMTKWLSTKTGFIEGFTETNFKPTRLYEYQKAYLEDKSLFRHIDKARQCLPKGSMIYTPNGPIEIERLRPGDKIYSYNIDDKSIEIDEVEDAWESGIRKCESILTRSGNKITAGENHPFLMELKELEYIKNKDLKNGDKFVNCVGKFGIIAPFEAEIKLLAYFITDGYTKPQPKFTNNNIELINDFIEAVTEIDPTLEFRIEEKGKGYDVYPHLNHGTNKKNSIHTLLLKWDFYKKRKEEKILPSEVFLWDKESIVLLLNRIFACDGWYGKFHYRRKETDKIGTIGIGSSSKKFLYQIQQLLWNFGIDSKVRHSVHAGPSKRFENLKDFWKLIVGYRGAINKFYNEIGILNKQNKELRDYEFRIISNNRIVKIKEDAGEQKCFDISVKKNKNFIFEGFVVHNTGFSYIFAAEGVAESHLLDKYTVVYISINQEEANQKIVFARELYDSIPLEFKKKLVVDNKKSLEFESYIGQKRARTRIVSHAQRPPRGKGDNTFVILDEAAHYTYGDKIYVAAMPIATRGYGGITVGSSPLGKTGIHWEISNNPIFKKIYSFHKVYWWNCPEFVIEGKFDEARKFAMDMQTPERVEKYGNVKIQAIFVGMDLESFKQEYECHHIDESVSYFPISLINRCCFSTVSDDIFLEDDENADKVLKLPMEEKYPRINFQYFTNLDDFIDKYSHYKTKGPLYGGFDVGRKHHTAELILIEEHPSELAIMRLRRSFVNESFEVMKKELRYAINNLRIYKLSIDETGPGIQLSEEMHKEFPGVCEGINFSSGWKEESASHVRTLFESQDLAIPDDRNVKNQIHSIKRIITEHGNLRLDVEKNKEHHGDIFWAIALACQYIRRNVDSTIYSIKMKDLEDNAIMPNIIKRPMVKMFKPNMPLIRVNDRLINPLDFNTRKHREY